MDEIEQLMESLGDETAPAKTWAEILRDNPQLKRKGGLSQLAQPGVMDELLGFKPPRDKMH